MCQLVQEDKVWEITYREFLWIHILPEVFLGNKKVHLVLRSAIYCSEQARAYPSRFAFVHPGRLHLAVHANLQMSAPRCKNARAHSGPWKWSNKGLPLSLSALRPIFCPHLAHRRKRRYACIFSEEFVSVRPANKVKDIVRKNWPWLTSQPNDICRERFGENTNKRRIGFLERVQNKHTACLNL